MQISNPPPRPPGLDLITTHVNLSDVRPNLTELLRRVRMYNTKVIIYSHDKKVAALVSIKDYERIWEAEEEDLQVVLTFRIPKTANL